MRDVIAKDLWDAQQSAHAQIIDLQDRQGSRDPGRLAAAYRQPFHCRQRREGPHARGDGRVSRLAHCASRRSSSRRSRSWRKSPGISITRRKAATTSTDRRTSPSCCRASPMTRPRTQVDDLIRHRLREMFKPTRKTAYDEVLPLPKLEEVADRVRKRPRSAHRQPRFEDSAGGGPEVLRRPQPEEQPLRSYRRQDGHGQRGEGRAPALRRAEGRWPHSEGPSPARRSGTKAADLRAGLQLHDSQPVRQGSFPDPARRQDRRSSRQSRST